MTDTAVEAPRGERPPAWRERLGAFRMERSLTGRELALACLALTVLAVLIFLPHVIHGGFYLDDWSNGAGVLDTPGGTDFGNVVSHFRDITVYRPVLILYAPLPYWLFGMDMALHLALAAALGVIVAALLYGVLRTLGVPWVHALFVAALTLLYPWFDSIRLWATADQISVAIVFALAGFWVALHGLSRRSWAWHAAAAVLYLLSILTYEVTLPTIAALGVVYVLRAGWRVARWRWAVDLAVVVAGAIWVGSHTARSTSSLSGDIEHLGEIIEGGAKIVGRSVLPAGAEQTLLALLAIGVVLVAGLVALKTIPGRFASDGGWGLPGWLWMGAGGLGVAVLGWVMFIPADPYYTPVVYGFTNRVNGVAGFGAVIAVYAALGVVGMMIGALWRRWGPLSLVVTLVLAILLGTAYLTVIRRHIGIWNSAYVAEEKALDKIKARYPDLPSGSTLFTSGYPAYQTLGVPILSTTWDLDGMIKLEYEDGSLAALPVVSGYSLACRPGGVAMVAGEETVSFAPYGRVRLFDIGSGKSAFPRSRQACQAVAGEYLPGPFYLSSEY